MVQLTVLTGSKAGKSFAFDQAPISVGRSIQDDLRVEDSGVWEGHFTIRQNSEGFTFHSSVHALCSVNGAPFQEAKLKNGDVIQAGASKFQFALTPPKKKSQREQEIALWICVACVLGLEIFLLVNYV